MELLELMKETEWGLDVKLKEGAIIDDSNFIEMIKQISNRCKEIEKKRILVDLNDFKQEVGVMKLYDSVIVSDQIIGHGLRVALLAPHLINDIHSKFVENVGFNRSIDVKYFQGRDAAMKWLLR